MLFLRPGKVFSRYYHLIFLILMALLSKGLAVGNITLFSLAPSFFTVFSKSCCCIFFLAISVHLYLYIWPRLSCSKQNLIQESWAPFCLIGLSLFLFRDFYQYEIPATTDHTTHMLRCWLTEHALWNYGTLLPWTSALGAGAPLNDLYPPGGAMLYCLIRLLTGFQCSLSTSYFITVFVSWFILLGALYGIGRYLFGCFGGFFAALLLVFDVGAVDFFGWGQCFSTAQWPMTLSGGLTIIALFVYIISITRTTEFRFRHIALPIVVMSAVLAHVFALPVLCINCFAIAVSGYFWSSNRRDYIVTMLTHSGLIIIGIAMASWWVTPFLASGEWVQGYGSLLVSPDSIMIKVFDGGLFVTTPPLFAFLGISGCIWGLLSKRPIPTTLALLYILNWIPLLDVFYEWFPSEHLANYIINVRAIRFPGYSKIWGVILAGGMVQPLLSQIGLILTSLVRRLSGETSHSQDKSPFHPVLSTFTKTLLASTILTFILPFGESVAQMAAKRFDFKDQFPLGRIHSESYGDYEIVMHNICENEPVKSGLEQFFLPFTTPRIGVRSNVIGSAIPFTYGFGIVTPPYTPTMVLTTRSCWTDVSSPILAQMKYFIGRGNPRRIEEVPGMKRLGQYGGLKLYENINYRNTCYEIIGTANGVTNMESIQPGNITLRLSGYDKKVLIRLAISRYRKWHAFLDGNEIPILELIQPCETSCVGKYITVSASNGLLELRYYNQWFDWAAYLISLFAFLILLWIIVYREPYQSGIQRFTQILISLTNSKSTYIYCCTALLIILCLYILLPYEAAHFWFSGNYLDVVGTSSFNKDKVIDLEFGLLLGKTNADKIIQSIQITAFNPNNQPIQKWTTETGDQWKLAFHVYDRFNYTWKRIIHTEDIQINPSTFLRIYAGNCFREKYISNGTTVHIEVVFKDGGILREQCVF